MLKQTVICLLLGGASILGAVRPAAAQQTVNFNLGYFTPRGQDARVSGDVLVDDQSFLSHRDDTTRPFSIGDFNSASIGAEWLIPFGNFFEGGAGIGFTRRTVPTVYTDFVNANGNDVEQELRLRTVPISFTVRALPFGQQSPVQPYIGGGLAIVNWRYSESGQFIDFNSNNEVFTHSFVGSGNATGPVVLGGVRFAGDVATAGFEIRYQKAEGDLESTDFASPKIDLGGWTYGATIGVRFGR